MAAGERHLQNSDFDNALTCYRTVLNKCPESVDASLGFAEALLNMKQYANASSVIVTVLQKDSENVRALFLRANCQFHLGHLSAAATLLSNIIRLDPDNKKASALLKRCRRIENFKQQADEAFRAENIEEAIQIYTQALEEDPPSAVATTLYANRSAALKKVEKYEDAIKDLTKAIEMDQDYIKAYTRRAQCYSELKMYAEAVRDYEWVLHKDPQNREIMGSLKEAKRLKKIAERKDYYKLLEVSKDASDNDIKKSYKKLAVKLHPDKHPPEQREEAEKKFKELNEAHGVLSDEKKRQQYDAGADLEEIEQGGGPGFSGFQGGVPEEMFASFFGGRGRQGFRSGGGGFNFHFG